VASGQKPELLPKKPELLPKTGFEPEALPKTGWTPETLTKEQPEPMAKAKAERVPKTGLPKAAKTLVDARADGFEFAGHLACRA